MGVWTRSAGQAFVREAGSGTRWIGGVRGSVNVQRARALVMYQADISSIYVKGPDMLSISLICPDTGSRLISVLYQADTEAQG